jgi:EVE domain
MVGRILRHHQHGRKSGDAIGMALDLRVPEILRLMVLANEKATFRRVMVSRKRQGKGNARLFPVGAHTHALEEKWLEIANLQRPEPSGICLGIDAFQHRHRHALAPRQRIAHKGTKGENMRLVRWDLARLGNRNQLQKGSGKLDDTVLRTPRVVIALANREAEAGIEIASGIKVTDTDDEMVKAPGNVVTGRGGRLRFDHVQPLHRPEPIFASHFSIGLLLTHPDITRLHIIPVKRTEGGNTMDEIRNWIAVASAEHVRRGREEGFMQVCHGKAAPLRRINPFERVAYYSPTVTFGGKDKCQAFTAIGTVRSGEPYRFDMGNNFVPFRKDVDWLQAQEAPIQPLLDQLDFTVGIRNWGYQLRFGLFAVSTHDMDLIAEAMLAESAAFGYVSARSNQARRDSNSAQSGK